MTRAKIATAAPIPMTRVVDAVIVNAGLRRRDLHAGRRRAESGMMGVVQVFSAYGRDLHLVSAGRAALAGSDETGTFGTAERAMPTTPTRAL